MKEIAFSVDAYPEPHTALERLAHPRADRYNSQTQITRYQATTQRRAVQHGPDQYRHFP